MEPSPPHSATSNTDTHTPPHLGPGELQWLWSGLHAALLGVALPYHMNWMLQKDPQMKTEGGFQKEKWMSKHSLLGYHRLSSCSVIKRCCFLPLCSLLLIHYFTIRITILQYILAPPMPPPPHSYDLIHVSVIFCVPGSPQKPLK